MRARSFAPKLCQNGRTLVSHRNLLCCVMPAVRLLPPDRFFDRSEWAAITRASPWRGIWLVAHAWIVTAVLLGVAAWSQNPLVWLLAVIFVGGRQLGLAILMHDAAHGERHPNRKINNFPCQTGREPCRRREGQ